MIKSRTMSIGLIVGSIIMSSHARAQPHVISGSNVWTPPGLEFNVCMQRGAAAMHQAGSTDVQQKIGFAGMGYIVGNIGDYHATIMCITFKGVVVFNVAGLDNLRKILSCSSTKAWIDERNAWSKEVGLRRRIAVVVSGAQNSRYVLGRSIARGLFLKESNRCHQVFRIETVAIPAAAATVANRNFTLSITAAAPPVGARMLPPGSSHVLQGTRNVIAI